MKFRFVIDIESSERINQSSVTKILKDNLNVGRIKIVDYIDYSASRELETELRAIDLETMADR